MASYNPGKNSKPFKQAIEALNKYQDYGNEYIGTLNYEALTNTQLDVIYAVTVDKDNMSLLGFQDALRLYKSQREKNSKGSLQTKREASRQESQRDERSQNYLTKWPLWDPLKHLRRFVCSFGAASVKSTQNGTHCGSGPGQHSDSSESDQQLLALGNEVKRSKRLDGADRKLPRSSLGTQEGKIQSERESKSKGEKESKEVIANSQKKWKMM